jgi:5-formyltetrahydrofolate cyclo-ligase
MNKEDFRKEAKSLLKRNVKVSAKSKHYRLFKPFLKLLDELKVRSIMIYNPLPYEPNLYALKRILIKKYEIFVPFMLGISLEMVKSRLPLVTRGKFGVKEPISTKYFKKRVDAVVVPSLGVDGNMARIGHGKGFYDRFFAGLPYRPLVIFVEILDNFTDKIISEDHDVICDFYITPSKIYVKRGIYDRDFNRIRSRCGGAWRRISSRQKDKRRQL